MTVIYQDYYIKGGFDDYNVPRLLPLFSRPCPEGTGFSPVSSSMRRSVDDTVSYAFAFPFNKLNG